MHLFSFLLLLFSVASNAVPPSEPLEDNNSGMVRWGKVLEAKPTRHKPRSLEASQNRHDVEIYPDAYL